MRKFQTSREAYEFRTSLEKQGFGRKKGSFVQVTFCDNWWVVEWK